MVARVALGQRRFARINVRRGLLPLLRLNLRKSSAIGNRSRPWLAYPRQPHNRHPLVMRRPLIDPFNRLPNPVFAGPIPFRNV